VCFLNAIFLKTRVEGVFFVLGIICKAPIIMKIYYLGLEGKISGVTCCPNELS